MPRSARQRAVRKHVLIYAGLLPFLVLAVFPILWMAITAVKQESVPLGRTTGAADF